MSTEDRLRIFVGVIVIVVLLGVMIGWDSSTLVNWLIPLGVSFIMTGIAADFLEKVTGDFFKNLYLSFEIFGKQFNVPVFLILTLVINKWLFQQ